jgi:hypothetical protein
MSVFPPETTVSVPVRAPNALGVKTTLIVQLAPPATEAQSLDRLDRTLKSPVAVAEVTCEVKLELLVQVNVSGAVV